ncbi:sensor histidine kinase [Fusobacterium nucleatum]|uniref:histidine kinase n=1 Tax=Fusobacterium nucleatum TaxID=851 RepID=A0A133PBG6_FUSNU|nr:sensor histidine kinase [Fusobacterium nucleatum]KXA25832.1 LytS/YhcK-type transmembrane receptor domain protein [Fusobacterium nucleatum]MCL4575652.1 membrane protein [Fusobacterium nucleatum YWH7056]MCL4582614.1 membrane protein [Fusobacterium nucleatum YWH7054]MCL4592373.1 membrane protein [Fusobacterium nucleatum YWH7053]
MNIQFISHLISNIGCSAIIAFFFIRIDKANIIIKSNAKTKKDIIALSFFFSLLSISGTYIGLNFNGAILNTRNVGVIAGGILGGPYVAIITGLVAGIHRAFVNLGKETAIPCAIATITGGFLTAYVHRFIKSKDKIFFGFFLACVVENLSMGLILIILKDKILAQNIVANFYVPMVFMNSIGSSVLILLVEDIIQKSELIAGRQAKLALEIANKTLPHFRETENLSEVCKIIAEDLGAKATVITNKKEIIAGFSFDKDEIKKADIKSNNTRKVLKTGETMLVIKEDDEIIEDFLDISPHIKSCIILPLKEKNDISGTLKIFFDTAEKITDKNRYLMIGLSHLISTQMEISKVENLISLLKYSELKALQSQINPHFLFNVLNTMTSLIRTNPEKAREVTIDLSNYLRYNLDNNVKSVELIKELNQVNTYIKIEKLRFGDKLNILYDVDESLYNFQIPSLIIQPLVENSIKHGILKKRDNGCVKIIIKKIGKDIEVIIEDDGIGIEQTIIDNLDKQIKENIGLKNVHQRLKLLYGEGLNIKKLEQGTRIKFKILGGVKYD